MLTDELYKLTWSETAGLRELAVFAISEDRTVRDSLIELTHQLHAQFRSVILIGLRPELFDRFGSEYFDTVGNPFWYAAPCVFDTAYGRTSIICTRSSSFAVAETTSEGSGALTTFVHIIKSGADFLREVER